MPRIFWATCRRCESPFLVSWELRHAGVELICPFCKERFLPENAKQLDERQ